MSFSQSFRLLYIGRTSKSHRFEFATSPGSSPPWVCFVSPVLSKWTNSKLDFVRKGSIGGDNRIVVLRPHGESWRVSQWRGQSMDESVGWISKEEARKSRRYSFDRRLEDQEGRDRVCQWRLPCLRVGTSAKLSERQGAAAPNLHQGGRVGTERGQGRGGFQGKTRTRNWGRLGARSSPHPIE